MMCAIKATVIFPAYLKNDNFSDTQINYLNILFSVTPQGFYGKLADQGIRQDVEYGNIDMNQIIEA